MIIDKSLLNISKESQSIDSFDIIQYSYNILSEASINTDLLILKESDSIVNDFIEKIFTGIVNGIIKALKAILSAIVGVLLKLLSMGKSFELEIRIYKDKIKNYNGNISFQDSYKYTYIYGDDFDKYPDKKIINNMIDDINNIIDKINKSIQSSKHAIELNQELVNIHQEITQKTSYRSQLLNSNEKEISDEIFNKKCFELFRNNSSVATNISYTGKEVYENIYLPYVEQKKMINKIKANNNDIQKELEKGTNQIKAIRINNINAQSDQEYQTLINNLQELQRVLCTYFEKNCKDIITIYATKLQAYKDSIVAAKPCLVKAIQEVNRIR